MTRSTSTARIGSGSRSNRQRGFAIIVGIFMMLVVAILGVAVNVTASTQQANQTKDLLGIQAYYAARAGLDYGIYRATKASWNCLTATSATFQLPGNLNRFWVTIECSQYDANQGALGTTSIWHLTATACNQPAAGVCPGVAAVGYVERRLHSSVTAN